MQQSSTLGFQQSKPSGRNRPHNLNHLDRDRGYRFMDRDPVMVEVTQAITESGRSLQWISERSGISVGTLGNWMNGTVRRPQHLTISFVMRALGREIRYVKIGEPEPEVVGQKATPLSIDEVFSTVKKNLRDKFLNPVVAEQRQRRRARQAAKQAQPA
jgi:hypothetical protein